MEVQAFYQREISAVRAMVDATMQGISDEDFNRAPDGTLNSIKAIFLHMLIAEDGYIQTILQEQPRIWVTEGWGERVGLPGPSGQSAGWDAIKETSVSLAPLLAYQQAVRAGTDAYLARLAADDLDREVPFLGAQRPAADVLAMLVVHTMGHAGEIAAIKGMMGLKGLPF